MHILGSAEMFCIFYERQTYWFLKFSMTYYGSNLHSFFLSFTTLPSPLHPTLPFLLSILHYPSFSSPSYTVISTFHPTLPFLLLSIHPFYIYKHSIYPFVMYIPFMLSLNTFHSFFFVYVPLILSLYTVSPDKHGNSVTIFNLSTSVQLGCKLNVLRGCVPASQAEVN